MIPLIISFYMIAIMLVLCSLGIIFAPRMFLALLSFVFLIVFSSIMLFELNSSYIAIFQLILCGIFLSGYIFLLLKNIGRLSLKNKLVPLFKIFGGICAVSVLGLIIFLYFKEDFSNSLFEIFNFVSEKSTSSLDLSLHTFPLYLVLLLVFSCSVVIRVFLLSSQNSALSSEGNNVDMKNEEGDAE